MRSFRVGRYVTTIVILVLAVTLVAVGATVLAGRIGDDDDYDVGEQVEQTPEATAPAEVAVPTPNQDDIGSDSAVVPMPLVSWNAPVAATSELQPAENAVNGNYDSPWRGEVPSAIEVELPEEFNLKQVVIAWYNDTQNPNFDFEAAESEAHNVPRDYTIDVSENGESWQTVEEVTGNTLHSRQHTIDLSGQRFVRLNISASSGAPGNDDVALNLDIHDARNGVEDSFIFFGDSITAGAMSHSGPTLPQMINQEVTEHFPVQINAGINGWYASQGDDYLGDWIGLFDGKFAVLAYGTNDAWSNATPEQFANDMQEMIDIVADAGKVAILPTIPHAEQDVVGQNVPPLNEVIDDLVEDNEAAITGPDLYALFAENPDWLSQDGVHPTDEGNQQLRAEWASFILAEIYGIE